MMKQKLPKTHQHLTSLKKIKLGLVLTLISYLTLLGLGSAAWANTPNNVQASHLVNQLANNPSSYLEMHAKDPIHWQTWQKNTLKTAQKDNRLIFISSGYFACHWCHVMHKENYLHPDIAQKLNKSFLSIKVDRELTPDLDQYLIDFSRKTTGVAGWPQHVFLTPNGYPFYSFIYLNNEKFSTLLQRIITLWEQDPENIEQIAKDAQPQAFDPKPLSQDILQENLIQSLLPNIDTLSGGLKTTSKFPKAPLLQSLLNKATLPEEIEDWLIFTLDQMQGKYNHLFDHINGGFYRYTIDPEWQIPHFEKMLYTQAQLISIYFQAGKKFNRPDYLITAQQTLEYAETHLFNPSVSLFLSSQSALDKQGIEGGNYLFNEQNLKKIFTKPQFQIVENQWKLDQAPPYDIGWHPKPTTQSWQEIKDKLKANPKDIPTDSKSLLGWNGLMLSAYAQAYLVSSSPETLSSGQQLANNLLKLIKHPTPPRALAIKGEFMGQANIQDYAFIIQGLTHWLPNLSSSAKQETLKEQIKHLDKTAQQKFLTPKGWLISESPLLPGQRGVWAMPDDAIPSPTAILDCRYATNLAKAAGKIKDDPIKFSSYLNCQPLK